MTLKEILETLVMIAGVLLLLAMLWLLPGCSQNPEIRRRCAEWTASR